MIDLDEPRCLDTRLTGAKAAALAHARAQGLPVLPGVVVPIDAGEAFFRRAVEALASGGSGAARLAALETRLEAELERTLAERVAALGQPVIVRSSSPLEGSGDWAGAFSTFHDVVAEELSTAVRGCWSSAFSVDALERAEAAGLAPEQLRLAVLIQPQLACEAGGIARVQAHGCVEVVGIAGSPAALLAGWEPGVRAHVTPGGAVGGDAARDTIGEGVLAAVAEVARQTWTVTGFDTIEWAWSADAVALLQLRRRPRPAPGTPPPIADPALADPAALQVAWAAHRWAGPLGEEHILPWAVAMPALPAVPPRPSTQPVRDWQEACRLSAVLTRRLWPSTEEARTVLCALRGETPGPALDRVRALPPGDPHEGARVLGLFAGVGAALAARGLVRSSAELWRCTTADVERALEHDPPAPLRPAGLTHWEPFVHAAARAHGTRLEGSPVTPGIGAGTLALMHNPHAAPRPESRPLLVAQRPLPGLAPLLWHSAGLVLGSSNPAAHLLEVAGSVGVPTVVGVDIEQLLAAAGGPTEGHEALVAVDGNAGTVAVVGGMARGQPPPGAAADPAGAIQTIV